MNEDDLSGQPELLHQPAPLSLPDYEPPQYREIPVPAPPPLIPNIGHAIFFFLLAVPAFVGGEVLSAFLLRLVLHPAGRSASLRSIFLLMQSDVRYSMPTQAIIYGMLILFAAPVFSLLWHRSFVEGIHWNSEIAGRRFFWLIALGLGVGFGISLLGNYLPMPKNPPIMAEMIKTPLGAWMMLIFGIFIAPPIEELAFRGFLLPALVNVFRWLARRDDIGDSTVKWLGIPASIVLTSIPFALLHAPQVSDSWGPLALIGAVSIVLCVVRLAMSSVAASSVVHAAYNFTLFAGILVETGGFRHLEKLTM
ncbi:CPBP family intramembrane glutamic endopeptidase [Paracidobacterium acidisoli]|uniref:CPBP family intramembrane metalloprotease n=1 Tax=Paracidobacterium acidisoli TaxID=2303751 RepID=A0A372ITV8_9BACT|nr:CPBP family intramembrane glutamic endopeptidase [Paracidobacterium acidisoli]MBT9329656.1 CPBP family intramembrane metalloprotease [Paracidobacterium acidisoli]